MVGRPRSEEARRAILRAALDLCARDGYANVTLKGIAEAAGAGRQTLYRWWQTKSQVFLEAVTDDVLLDTVGIEPRLLSESDDPRTDLRTFLHEAFALAEGVAGQVVVGLMTDAQSDPEFAAKLSTQLIGPRRAALRAVLEREALPPDLDLELVVDLIFGAMWYRLLNRHAPVDRTLAEEITALLARLTR